MRSPLPCAGSRIRLVRARPRACRVQGAHARIPLLLQWPLGGGSSLDRRVGRRDPAGLDGGVVAALLASAPLRSLLFVVLGSVLRATRRLSWVNAICGAVAMALMMALLAATVLLVTVTPAVEAYRYHQVQKEVVVNTVRIAVEHGAASVVLADYSGRLGDVYTLYPPTLQILLDAEGSSLLAVICTPRDVDRVDPVARRLLAPTTPRCDASGVIGRGQLIINVTQVGDDLSLGAA